MQHHDAYICNSLKRKIVDTTEVVQIRNNAIASHCIYNPTNQDDFISKIDGNLEYENEETYIALVLCGINYLCSSGSVSDSSIVPTNHRRSIVPQQGVVESSYCDERSSKRLRPLKHESTHNVNSTDDSSIESNMSLKNDLHTNQDHHININMSAKEKI
jgi:hypothetical protein